MHTPTVVIYTFALLFSAGLHGFPCVGAETPDTDLSSCALQKSGILKLQQATSVDADSLELPDEKDEADDKDEADEKDKGYYKDKADEKDEAGPGVGGSITFLNPDPSMLRWDTQADPFLAEADFGKGVVVKFGWLRVPLIHDKEQNSYSVQSVCLRVRGVTKMTHNKPPLFLHCGGPSTGRECTPGGTSLLSKLLDSFNLITINQRGLVLSDPEGADNPSLPDCPFLESSGSGVKPFPVLECDELSQKNGSVVLPMLDLAPNSTVLNEIVKPILGGQFSWTNETKIRWNYRVKKLEYEMCSTKPNYTFSNSTSGAKRSAFDLIGTIFLANDIDVFRQALGAEKLSCWGISYGTQVCGTYATVHPERLFRLVLDGNVDPRPDVVTWAEDSGYGQMAVFRGIAAACEASTLEPQDKCPLAPFMAEKLHKIMIGPDSIEQLLLNHLFNEYAMQSDVPCAAVMLSCMSWVVNGGAKPAGCVGKKVPLLTHYMSMSKKAKTSFIQASITSEIRQVQSLATNKDRFGVIPTLAIDAQDIHGRLTEEGVIAWWKDARERFTFGLANALLYAIGISIWPSIATPPPPVGDSQLQPLLIGNLRDGATSYIATQRMKQGFPQGHLLTYQGYGHGLAAPSAGKSNSAAFNSCFEHVSKYLLEGKLPEDGQTCAVLTTAKVSERDAVQLASKC